MTGTNFRVACILTIQMPAYYALLNSLGMINGRNAQLHQLMGFLLISNFEPSKD